MRIDQLVIENFKGFERRELSFHPEFNLVVGENGTGKTSVLEALSVAAGSWFLGLRDHDSRHIRPDDIRIQRTADQRVRWARQYPCAVKARGEVLGETISWRRTLNSKKGRTTYGQARRIKQIAAKSDERVMNGEDVNLPLISYYGMGRLWNTSREQARVTSNLKMLGNESILRLAGYQNSIDPRLSVATLIRWIAREDWITYQRGGREDPTFIAAKAAMVKHIHGAERLYFDAELGEVVVSFGDEEQQPFNNLSDGQRSMLALVGDIARKAATLNPHFGPDVLSKTSGLVLIDELDLHLHPKWQRHVIEDLRTTFPRIQFICTTHSPFLIQSLRSGEELIMLDGQPTAHLADQPIDTIARGIQGISNPEVSARYAEMKAVARTYLETLEEAEGAPEEKLAEYLEKLADSITPFADNPAFQAFLEFKRAVKLGA